MIKAKKLLSLLLSCAMVISTFAGCTGKNQTTDGKSGTKTGGKQIIRIAQASDVLSFDPHKINDFNTSTALRHIYSTLVKLTPDNQIVGDLAESWKNIDEKTIEFKLRPNVKFHNGETLKAEDVKFSIEREMASSAARHMVKDVESMEVVDDLTVIMHLKKPSAPIFASLTYALSGILCKSHVEALEASGKTIDDKPNGTGQYKFGSYKSGDQTVLVKYDDYFGEKAANDQLVLKIIPDGAARTIALETGDVDIVNDVNFVDVNRIIENDKLDLINYPSTGFEHVLINNQKKPFDNVKVRQALNHAVERASIIKVAANGQAVAADSYISSGAMGYSKNVTVYDYDIAKAKALLAEAGYPDGFEASILVFTDQRNRTAQVLQASFGEIGIKLSIESMEKGAFYEKTNVGDYDMAILGWTADADPSEIFDGMWHSAALGETGNRQRYINPEVDKLLEEASAEMDMAKRLVTYEKIQQIITADAGVIPIYYLNGLIGRSKNVEGIVPFSIGSHRFEQAHFVK
ncbi:MAG: ABC transporter substrate-binding protein [Oscillospiraceae bacterium]